MMSVVGKSTCSGFKIGLYISYHGGNVNRYIKQWGYFLKSDRISGYFDTKYMKILRIEQILHNFEDQKFFKPGTGQFSCDTRQITLIFLLCFTIFPSN